MKKQPSKPKANRQTLNKQIVELVQQGKVYDALKLARGWMIREADAARLLVDRWRAVEIWERNPDLSKHAPNDFYAQLLEKSKQRTCTHVRNAIATGDSEFFIRIAKIIKADEPREDELRVAVLADMLRCKMRVPPLPEKPAKKIAISLLGSHCSLKQIETKTSEVNRLRRALRA